MTSSPPHLPGRLGNPNLTLAEDPRLDPRLAASVRELGGRLGAELRPDAPYADVLEYIQTMEATMDALYPGYMASLPPIAGVTRRSEVIEGVDHSEIRLFVHEPAERGGPLPGILHTHGGAMVMCAAADEYYARVRDELAATGLVVVGVEFRNGGGKLGNHPFPAGLDDCVRAARWVHAEKGALGIRHVVVSGESGGGNLCLAVALRANREGWIDEIAGVYSLCPLIAGRYSPIPPELPSWHENDGYLLESGMMHALATAYDPGRTHADDPLAWPLQATTADLAGLPPHVISVNELDPLRDEGILYARKLRAAGVSTVARTVLATHHGADVESTGLIPDVHEATLRDIHGFAAALSRRG